MRFRRFPKALRSIHTRLLLVILAFGLAVNLLVVLAGFVHRVVLADAFRRSVAQYVHYLAKDIGSPPDKARALDIAKRTGMNIYYFSPETQWSTTGQSLPAPLDQLDTLYDEGSVQVGVTHGRHYLVYRGAGQERLLFDIVRNPAGDYRLVGVAVLLAVLVTLLLAGVYYWIRRIMAPLRQLSLGVQEFGLGSLDHRISVDRTDDLGELARAFNNMADRLQQLIGTKERMLRDVSHELRSPLTRMKVALEMACEGDFRDSLKEDVVEMERMVTAILENARSQSGAVSLHCEKCDLVHLIQEVVKAHEHEPPGVLLDSPNGPARICIDAEKVRTVLRNIIENGLKYSGKDSAPVVVRVLQQSDQITVEIRDHGIGIPEEDMSFIFEPFYRVDPSRSRETGGFGLGLTLCKAIMTSHGGAIFVDSSSNFGTTVSLVFPLGG